MTILRRGVAAIAIGGTALLLSACSTVAPTTAAPEPGATTAPAASDGGLFGGGWMTWILVALLVVMVFFMWRNSRKRKAAAAQAQSAMVPGAEVMTSFGLFGTLVSVDEVTNSAELEISPGNVVKVHRQTLVKVVDPSTVPADAPRSVEEAMEIADREQREREAKIERDISELSGESLEEPRFGERIKDAKAAEDGDEGDAPKKS
jgi:preprotein translocase subunit YajC